MALAEAAGESAGGALEAASIGARRATRAGLGVKSLFVGPPHWRSSGWCWRRRGWRPEMVDGAGRRRCWWTDAVPWRLAAVWDKYVASTWACATGLDVPSKVAFDVRRCTATESEELADDGRGAVREADGGWPAVAVLTGRDPELRSR